LRPDVDRFYRTLAREAPDAIVYTDTEGLIAFWNKGAERTFGFSEVESIGKHLSIIIPENLRKRHWDGYAERMRTEEPGYGAEYVIAGSVFRKDGKPISIEFTLTPFFDRVGRLLGVAAILRDVTKRCEEIKRLHKE
jgi:PAS domain S-box-containing protein